jgi:ABC-type Na+ efflux pump permease subunit
MLQISKIFAKNDYPTLLFMILPVLAFIMLSIFSLVHLLFLTATLALLATGYHLAALCSAQREAQQIALTRQQLITRWQSYKEIGH